MGQIILVTGGVRSGKSRLAESLCQQGPGPHYYIATCPRIAGDTDLSQRILKHQADRAHKQWITKEELLHIEPCLNEVRDQGGSALLECLGLWLSNILYQNSSTSMESTHWESRIRSLCSDWRKGKGTLVVVAAEAGWGMLPLERESRQWLDLLGLVRNTFAAEADAVWLAVSGLSLQIK